MKKLIIIPLSAVLLLFSASAFAATHRVIKESRPFFMPKVYTRELLELSIQGNNTATREQCVNHLLLHNPYPYISVSPAELVEHYYEEAQIEGIRADVAFAQALHETGYFRYGGDVVAMQNNYCGLGTIGGGVKGAWFPDARTGVRAHIQHLLAYCSTRSPATPIVDPRYTLVRESNHFGQCRTWTSLGGHWAVPGEGYGEKIQIIHTLILTGK